MTLGRIFIAAVAEGEAFDPVAHARTDWDVVEYTLSRQDENSFWQCECEVIPTGGSLFRPTGKNRVHISEEVNGVVMHVFTGRIEGWPYGSSNKPVTLTVKGKPPVIYMNHQGLDITGNQAVQYDQARWIYSSPDLIAIYALKDINDDPYYVFSDQTDKRTPEMVLAARSALLNWMRDDSAPQLTDLLHGAGTIATGEGYIEGSLEFDQPSQPISSVEVTLKAEWANALVVKVDLADQLRAQHIPTFFGTLSSPDWSSFPRAGTKLGDWTVTKSNLTPNGAPQDAGSIATSVDVTAPANENMDIDASNQAATRVITFYRQFYDIDVEAMTVLKANRRETLTFRLSWGGQEFAGYQGTTEKVDLDCRNLRRTLQDIPQWPGPGVAIARGTIVQNDGSLWYCITPHVTGTSLYVDMGKWDAALLDTSPVGGEVVQKFFGGTARIDATSPTSGNQYTLTRLNGIPGLVAMRYALGQARAKLISGVRIIKATFEVPWEDVRTITGRERVSITLPNGRTMTGKVVTVSAQLVKGTCSITIAAAPGSGGLEPVLNSPVYFAPILQTDGIVGSTIINGYADQEAALAAAQASGAKIDFAKLIESMPTRFQLDLAPTGGTAEFPVTIDMGTLLFNCDKMVDLTP